MPINNVFAELRRRHQDHSECPRCQTPIEDTEHVLLCPHPEATATWDLELGKLHNWLIDHHTDPRIGTLIMDGLRAWRKNIPHRHGYFSPDLRTALSNQRAIGWDNFLMGRMSKNWATAQTSYLRSIGRSRSSGTLWLRQLIQRVWDITWQLWEHRNNILHNSMTPRKQAELDNLRDQARREFAKGQTGLDPNDYDMLEDKDEVLEMTLTEIKLWVQAIRLARAAYQRTAARIQWQMAQSHLRSKLFMRQFLERGYADVPEGFGTPAEQTNPQANPQDK